MKIWNVESGECAHELQVADTPQLEDMQLAVEKIPGYIVSISLSGAMNFWDVKSVQSGELKPQEVYCNHRKPIIGWGANQQGQLVTLDKEGLIITHNFNSEKLGSDFFALVKRLIKGVIIS
mgnify:CR=1 FL=1